MHEVHGNMNLLHLIYSDLKHRDIYAFLKDFFLWNECCSCFQVSHAVDSKIRLRVGERMRWRGLPEKSSDLKYDHFSKPLRQDSILVLHKLF